MEPSIGDYFQASIFEGLGCRIYVRAEALTGFAGFRVWG